MNPGLSPSREVLANGVTVLAKETRTTPAVTVLAFLRAGSVYDPPDCDGIAHFVSRTVDRGTERHTADDIAEQLDYRGVTLLCSVSRHVLSLACTCLVDDFDDVLALVADVVTCPRFPSTEVDRRRGEIMTLIRQDEDNPATVSADTLMAMLYGTHPYGRRIRGSVENVQRIDAEALRRFYAERGVPSGLSLAVVGDIEPQRVVEAAHAAFGNWAPRPFIEISASPVQEPTERRCQVVQMMNKAQTDIAYGFATIARQDASYHAYSLMNNILGQYSLGGRLGDSIRETQGMAYYVFSALEANVMPGPLVVRAGVSAANVQKAVASIDAELQKLMAEPPTAQEITESKQYLIGSMPRTLETNMGIATYLQTAEMFGLGLDYDLRMPALLQAVTAEQVHEVARRSLNPDRATVVVAGPYEGPLS